MSAYVVTARNATERAPYATLRADEEDRARWVWSNECAQVERLGFEMVVTDTVYDPYPRRTVMRHPGTGREVVVTVDRVP